MYVLIFFGSMFIKQETVEYMYLKLAHKQLAVNTQEEL